MQLVVTLKIIFRNHEDGKMTATNWDAEGNDEGNFWEVELKIAAENKLLKQNARIPRKPLSRRSRLAFIISSQAALKISQDKIDSVIKV